MSTWLFSCRFLDLNKQIDADDWDSLNGNKLEIQRSLQNVLKFKAVFIITWSWVAHTPVHTAVIAFAITDATHFSSLYFSPISRFLSLCLSVPCIGLKGLLSTGHLRLRLHASIMKTASRQTTLKRKRWSQQSSTVEFKPSAVVWSRCFSAASCLLPDLRHSSCRTCASGSRILLR